MEKKISPIYPNSKFKTFCYINSVVTNPNIIVGDYSYYENIEEIKKLIPLLTGDLSKSKEELKALLND